jgi:hypothetical protein
VRVRRVGEDRVWFVVGDSVVRCSRDVADAVIARACFELRLARVGSWACGGTVSRELGREAAMTEQPGGGARAEKRGTSEILVTWRRVHSCRFAVGLSLPRKARVGRKGEPLGALAVAAVSWRFIESCVICYSHLQSPSQSRLI